MEKVYLIIESHNNTMLRVYKVCASEDYAKKLVESFNENCLVGYSYKVKEMVIDTYQTNNDLLKALDIE